MSVKQFQCDLIIIRQLPVAHGACMFFLFHDYCRTHSSLPGKQVSAMACGLAHQVLTVEELVRLMDAPACNFAST